MINIVIYQCEKPSNLGNILRTCAASGVKLHIIGPLTFPLDDHALKRAGMDYITTSDFVFYPTLDDFFVQNKNTPLYCITRYGNTPPSSCDFSHIEEDYYVIFGSESSGLPQPILAQNNTRWLRLPMLPMARSLNLANCVAIVIYEILRQQNYWNLASSEELKSSEYIRQLKGEE